MAEKLRRVFLYFSTLAVFGMFVLFAKIQMTADRPTPQGSKTPILKHPPPPPVAAIIPSYNLLKRNLVKTMKSLSASSNKMAVDYLLNIRKLTLFAVHELNTLVSNSPANLCSRTVSCPKWWANPLKSIYLNTSFTSDHFQHNLTFVAEPGRIPFSISIRQNPIPDIGADFNELEITGEFSRVQTPGSTSPEDPVDSPPILIPQTLNSYNLADNQADPELFSWKRDQSFLIGDYVNFSSTTYNISPGERLDKSTVLENYCGSALKMLVMVSSAPHHFQNRRVIRETWGSEAYLVEKNVRLVFLFGRVENQTLQKSLEEEAAQFDDLIQGDFMDSYHNLSISHLLMYNWIQRTCESVGLPRYVLKTDDDFFLNIPLALEIAYTNPEYELIGTLYCGTKPVRHIAYMTKYYTPRYMHTSDFYVGYLSGVAYILRTDIIPRMLQISYTTPMIHMDDVYVTGLLSRQINVTPVGSNLFTYVRTNPEPCALRKIACSSAEGIIEDIRLQWSEFNKPIPSNCSFEDLKNDIKVRPLTLYDKTACIFQ